VTSDAETANFGTGPAKPRPEPTALKEKIMSWTAPVVVEICAGLEVTAYLTAEM
jgi:coenzyme PQQ precursor peptide PqqA